MTLVIDNYDSFTYNLVQYLEELGERTIVFRNDTLSVLQLKKKKFDRIVISPGPGTPSDSGISCQVISQHYKHMPILGVCLGHQCIGHVFGGRIVRAAAIMHGKTSLVYHDKKGIFAGIKSPFEATRYHSLVIDPKHLPGNLSITAYTKDNVIMGVREKHYPLFGVQFHPESILTVGGKNILKNFIEL